MASAFIVQPTTAEAALCARLDAERTIDLERYREEGCDSRSQYLSDLADDHGLTLRQIEAIVDQLGPDEDFDGLVVTLEDHADMIGGF